MKKRKIQNTASRRHLNCAWLYRLADGSYRCNDSRGPKFGKKMTQQEALEKACEFFHVKK